MKLSIIVPVYNMAAEDKLTFCIDSLIGQQNIEDYEIICVDDMSTDTSPEILREYAGKYPDKIKVIYHKENKKQGGARNTGIKAATGEWIGFMDSDDWADPLMYHKLLSKAEETGADVVGCDYQFVSKHSFEAGEYVPNSFAEQTGILQDEQKRQLCLGSGSMVVKIYKRDVIESNNLDFPEKMFYEDNAAAPIWMLSFKHFEHIAEPLYFYYQHENSTVHTVNTDRLMDRIKAGEILLKEAQKREFWDVCKEELIYKYVHLAFCNTLFSYAQAVPKMDIRFLKEIQTRIVKTLANLQRMKDLQEEQLKPEGEIDDRKVKQLKSEMDCENTSAEKNGYYASLCMITNKYYHTKFDAEQRKFLEMFLKSPRRMKLHYEVLMLYRKIRYESSIKKRMRER